MEEDFVPLNEDELQAYKDEVWQAYAIGEITEAEAASMIVYEAWINGLIEA